MATTNNLPVDLREGAMQAVCRQYGMARLALFGSVLRDDFTEQSDIDVLSTLLLGFRPLSVITKEDRRQEFLVPFSIPTKFESCHEGMERELPSGKNAGVVPLAKIPVIRRYLIG